MTSPFNFPIRCSQFEDLFSNVLFNYQWLYAKMSACPLQAVLSDFEDACNHVTDKDARYHPKQVAMGQDMNKGYK